MQVRVAEQDARTRKRPLQPPHSLDRGRGSGWGSPSRPRSLVLPDLGAAAVLLLLAVLLGIAAAESFNVHFEFRKQGFTWSPSELAFVIALVTLGGAWTAVARAPRSAPSSSPRAVRGQGSLQRQRRRPRGCAAVSVLRVLPTAIAYPATWLSYLRPCSRQPAGRC